MDSNASPATFEVCPVCSQRTASQLFRTVKKKRLCLLCAKRADDAEVTSRAQVADQQMHGGMGWLWKHIAYTAWGAGGAYAVRCFVMSYLHRH